MSVDLTAQQALDLWRRALSTSFHDGRPDLSARQMAIMLSVYTTTPPHTVRGLSRRLNISKPAVVRALDLLCEHDFVRRRRDDEDKRNVLIQRTVQGSVFLREFADHVINAAKDL